MKNSNRALFQDDLHIPQDYDLQDRAPRTITRNEIQSMMSEYTAKGGKVKNVTIPRKRPLSKVKWNYMYTAKDGSNLTKQAPKFINEVAPVARVNQESEA